jgi:iron complex outermembrane receptor protein
MISSLIIGQNVTKKDTIKYQMAPITVTATRYAENIIEIPYAVTVLPKEQLQISKGYGLDEVLNNVPGVLTQSRAGTQDVRIVIRGFGARGAGDRSNSGTSRGIRVMMDGIPETEPDGRTSFDNIDITNAENIEVVRSNASSLWGNAAGGIVNISTVPEFKDYFFSIKGFTGSFGFRKLNVQGGSELTNGKIFGSYSQSNFDGWRQHSSGKRTVVNLGIISELGKDSKLGLFAVGTSNLFRIPGPLTLEEFNKDQKLANPTYLKRDERRYNRLGRLGATFEHKINQNNEISAMMYVNPKYLQRSERNTFRDFTRYHFGGNFVYRNIYNFSEDLHNSLSLGADESYQDGAILFYNLSANNGRGETLKSNKREGANTFGAFVQNELRINDKISILLGGRYDNVTYYSEDFLEPKLGLQKKSFEHFTPKAGFTYLFKPSHSIYFNLGGGVEVPAGNETDPAITGVDLINPLLEPIVSTTYELGTKHVYFVGSESILKSVTYDVALYYIDIKNDIIPYNSGKFYITAGKTHRMGIELGTNIQLKHGISLSGSLTYSSNKYDDYVVDSTYGDKYGRYDDNKVAGIPDMFYSASISYIPNFMQNAFISITFNGMGKYFVDDANQVEVPSYNIINASFGVKEYCLIKDHLNVSFFLSINNLTNKKYIASAFINPDLDSKTKAPIYIEPGLERNYVFSVMFGIN